jgi:hypothetical protein
MKNLARVELLLFCLATKSAMAVCDPTTEPHANKNGLKLFRVNASNVSAIGMNATDFIQAVVLGANAWNEQGNGGYFEYDGETNLTTLSETGCGQNYSIVTISDTCSTFVAANSAKCDNEQFVVTIYADQQAGCAGYPYGNGAGSSTVLDVAGLMTHEFGHSQGIGDQGPQDCTMFGVYGASYRTVQHRDLYERDLSQSFDCSGRRVLAGYKTTHSSTGFSTASVYTGGASVTKVSSGLAYDGSTAYFASTYHGGSSIQWDEGVNGADATVSNVGATNAIGLSSGLWREDSATDRMFYSFWDDDGTGMTSNHLLRTVTSTNKFSSAPTISNLSYCTGMSAWMTCSGTTNTHSAHRVAVGWLANIGESVTVWTEQDHSSSATSTNEIKIAVGTVNSSTLPDPSDTGLYSSVSPGVACFENFSGTLDCVLVYVPMSDTRNGVVSRRFSVTAQSNSYSIGWNLNSDYDFPAGTRTSGAIAVWYSLSHSKFFAAWRSTSAGQRIEVASSTDGASWSFVTYGLDATVAGPSAASMWRGNDNIIVYAR